MLKSKGEIIKLHGRYQEVVTVHDDKGNVLHKILRPLMLEFRPKDIVQVMVGATILAIPVGFTEETWVLGSTLPLFNVLWLVVLSLIFIGSFSYYNYYRHKFKAHHGEYVKRVLATYVFSFLVVALLLTIIDKAPWQTEFLVALKRSFIVTLPASMSAAVADSVK